MSRPDLDPGLSSGGFDDVSKAGTDEVICYRLIPFIARWLAHYSVVGMSGCTHLMGPVVSLRDNPVPRAVWWRRSARQTVAELEKSMRSL